MPKYDSHTTHLSYGRHWRRAASDLRLTRQEKMTPALREQPGVWRQKESGSDARQRYRCAARLNSPPDARPEEEAMEPRIIELSQEVLAHVQQDVFECGGRDLVSAASMFEDLVDAAWPPAESLVADALASLEAIERFLAAVRVVGLPEARA
jgi:hypothetical protein